MQFYDISKIISPNYEKSLHKAFKFALVGATGAVLNLGILYALTNYIHIWYMTSALVAVETAILWCFYLNTKITFDYRFIKRSDIAMTIFKYHLSSFAGLIINITALFVLTEFLNIYYLLSEFFAIIFAFGINYILSAKYVWYEKGNLI